MIGIFDSGVGGLSVWKELILLFPNEEFVYVADSGHCPYGPKSKEEIIGRGKIICDFLISKGAQIIVIACNTATAAAVTTLRKIYSLPIVGMEPAIKPAALSTKSGVIGVLATQGTFKGRLYNNTRNRYAYNKRVIEQIGNGLVEIVETSRVESQECYDLLNRYLSPMLNENADCLVLGCTHYPFLINPIKEIVGERMKIINPAPAIALRVKELQQHIQNQHTSNPNNSGNDSLSRICHNECNKECFNTSNSASNSIGNSSEHRTENSARNSTVNSRIAGKTEIYTTGDNLNIISIITDKILQETNIKDNHIIEQHKCCI